jgi:hypothetical protein
MDILLVSRILITPLMLIELGIVGWYFLYWDLFPKYSVRRLLPWAILLLSTIGIPLLQIAAYKDVTSQQVVQDPFVPILISTESAASVALAFCLLLRRRLRNQ